MSHFQRLPNALSQSTSEELSNELFRIVVFRRSQPEDYTFTEGKIREILGCGRHTYLMVLREAEEKGWLVRQGANSNKHDWLWVDRWNELSTAGIQHSRSAVKQHSGTK